VLTKAINEVGIKLLNAYPAAVQHVIRFCIFLLQEFC